MAQASGERDRPGAHGGDAGRDAAQAVIGEALLHGVQEALMRPSRVADIDYEARARIERRQAEIAAMLARWDAALRLEQLREAAH